MTTVENLSLHTVSRRSAATDFAIDVINELPHVLRLVLLFTYCEGMTIREIARSLGINEVRVRDLHDEAMRQLQSNLPKV
jgi:RNA polymerase sigma factor (sigma-70 family)